MYEARYSKDSEKCFYLYASEAKHTSVYALLLKRHPCRFWLLREQSPKNIYASHKSRDMHKYNILYTIKLIEHVLTPESIKLIKLRTAGKSAIRSPEEPYDN